MSGPFELGDVSPLGYFSGVAVVLGLAFFLVAPTPEGGSPLSGLLLWQLQTALPLAMLLATHRFLLSLAAFRTLGRWWQLVLSGVAGALLFTPVALLLDVWLAGEGLRGSPASELADELLAMGPPVVLCWVGINAPWVLGYRLTSASQVLPTGVPEAAGDGQSDQAAPAGVVPFLQQVPAGIGTDLVSLRADLHYVTVTTTRGNALILYRLKDAIDELAGTGVEGLQCHRSWWVNRRHVLRLRQSGRQGWVILDDGSEVPVSRRRLDETRARLAQWAASRGQSVDRGPGERMVRPRP